MPITFSIDDVDTSPKAQSPACSNAPHSALLQHIDATESSSTLTLTQHSNRQWQPLHFWEWITGRSGSRPEPDIEMSEQITPDNTLRHAEQENEGLYQSEEEKGSQCTAAGSIGLGLLGLTLVTGLGTLAWCLRRPHFQDGALANYLPRPDNRHVVVPAGDLTDNAPRVEARRPKLPQKTTTTAKPTTKAQPTTTTIKPTTKKCWSRSKNTGREAPGCPQNVPPPKRRTTTTAKPTTAKCWSFSNNNARWAPGCPQNVPAPKRKTNKKKTTKATTPRATSPMTSVTTPLSTTRAVKMTTIQLPSSSGNISEPIRYIFKKDGQILRRHVLPTRTDSGKISTTVIPLDDVKKIKLNYSCIESRNGLSIVDWMRVVGATLEEPVTNLARESKIIDSVNAGLGCPTDEELAEIKSITEPLDKTITSILTLLPGSQPLAIAQNIIGPLLQVMADDLEGKDPNSARYSDLNSQLLAMAWQLVHSFTPGQRAQLYNEPNADAKVTDKEKEILVSRFSYRDGNSIINIDGYEYVLQERADGMPFVIDLNQQPRLVHYVNAEKKWVFIKSDPYRIKNTQEKKARYGISLAELPAKYSMRVDEQHGYIILTAPAMPETTGIFIDDSFIPAKFIDDDNELVALTNTPGQTEAIALKNDNILGWQFDPPSTKMDTYLKLLLQSKDIGVTNSLDYNILPIDPVTAISKNTRDELFIKHNDKYFKTMLTYNKDIYNYAYTVEGFSHAKVKLEYDTLILASEDNMLFPFHSHTIRDSSNYASAFMIEKSAVKYLMTHAKLTAASATNIVQAGFHLNADGVLMFGVYSNQFHVTKQDGRKLYLERDPTSDRTDDIILWSDSDYYLRVRDESERGSPEYKEINTCRAIRSPSVSGRCIKIMIEDELDKKLLTYTDETANNAHPSPESLVASEIMGIQDLYKDEQSQQYYYRYNDLYFDADIIPPTNKYNPTGLTGLRLSGKGNFFNRNKHIADIYLENKEDRIEIKTAETFISENINTNNQISTHYIKKRPWVDLTGMELLETLVSQAKSTQKVSLNSPSELSILESTSADLTDSWGLIREQLLPPRIAENNDYIIIIHSLDSNDNKPIYYEQKAAQYITEKINYLKNNILPITQSSLYYDSLYWPEAEEYIATVLGNNDMALVNDIATALQKNLRAAQKIITKALHENKIHLVFARHRVEIDASIEPMSSLLTPEEIAHGAVVISLQEKLGPIFINIDKLDFMQKMNPAPNNDLISEFLQTILQVVNKNSDYFNIEKKDGIHYPIKDAIYTLRNKLQYGGFSDEQIKKINTISEPYIKSIEAYLYDYETSFKEDPKKLAYLLDNDPEYLAHLLIHSSNFLTLMIQDIHHIVSRQGTRDMPDRIDSRMRKYDAMRGFSLYDPEIVNGLMPLREIVNKDKVYYDIKSIIDFDADAYLQEMKNRPEISKAILKPKENCEYIITSVADYLKEKHFENIRYRGIALFLHAGDNMPSNHFVVVGSVHGNDYVFDLTAGQFSNRYAEFTGPIILPESDWAQKFANLDGKALITYGDYTTRSEARRLFGPDSKFLSWGPTVKIPKAQVLRRPRWYFPYEEIAASAANRAKNQLENANSLKNTARRSMLQPVTVSNCWDYATSLLENAELISREPAIKLSNGLKMAAASHRYNAPNPGSLEGLFESTNEISNMEDLLRIKAGAVVVFMRIDPQHPASGYRPIHAMVSMGNGRFAGIKNSKISSTLSDSEKIYIGEQLGYFQKDKLLPWNEPADSASRVIAGSTEELMTAKKYALRSLAVNTHSPFPENLDIVEKMTDMLRDSGELSEEQSIILQGKMSLMMKQTDNFFSPPHSFLNLLSSPKEIRNNVDLHRLTEGKLVLFRKPSGLTIEHFMYSLGEGDFLMLNPEKLDMHLSAHNALVKASQFSDFVLSQFHVVAGVVSLVNLRLESLLGAGSFYHVKGNELTLSVHARHPVHWNLNAFELAEIIKGLGLKIVPPVDWAKIDSIVLNARSATSGALSTGKMLAKILQKKVTATTLIATDQTRNSPFIATRTRIYPPDAVTPEELNKLRQQATRMDIFKRQLQKLFRHASEGRSRRAVDAFSSIVNDIADLANGETTVQQFFTRHPEYEKQLYTTTPKILEELIADKVNEESAFVRRCMDIIDLSEYTMLLMDNYLA